MCEQTHDCMTDDNATTVRRNRRTFIHSFIHRLTAVTRPRLSVTGALYYFHEHTLYIESYSKNWHQEIILIGPIFTQTRLRYVWVYAIANPSVVCRPLSVTFVYVT